MDVAQEFESALILRQKPVNEAIEKGDSDIQQFYKDSVVFVTGASGFLGKQFIEKLLRSCDIKKVYILLRSKKGKTMQQRLSMLLKDSVYENLHKFQPGFTEKVVAVEGDINEIGLGICNDDWKTITGEINVIVHMAATTRFNEPLRVATITNVRGTREVIRLGKECQNLRSLVHVSTAFAHTTHSRINKEVLEQFYPSPLPPQTLIDLAEHVDARLEDITPGLLKDYENTYVFTKAVAEEAVRVMAGDLPVCIVKPPVVLSSYYEPSPGWIDTSALFGASGMILGVGTGTIHVCQIKNVSFNIAPVDYVNNAIIAASWDIAMRQSNRETEIPIYTISSSSYNITLGTLCKQVEKKDIRKYSSPKAVWACYLLETESKFVYWLLTWLLHYIPGYIVDGVCFMLGIKLKDIPSVVKIYTKVYNMSEKLSFFMTNEWIIKDDNCKELFMRLSPTDKLIYNFDISTIDWNEFIITWCLGLRKYVLKDGLEGSAYGKKKQAYLRIANYIFMSLYLYVIWKILYFFYTIVLYLFILFLTYF